MQTQVMFYLLNNDNAQSSRHYQACLQAAYYYRNNQRVFIYTEDQTQAHEIDELLWGFEPESFVPHNLVGEGPRGGAPVEISWQQPTSRRPVLINLTNTMPNFANNFAQIIDFVPTDEPQKQLARERFKAYRQWGFQVDNQAIVSSKSTEITPTETEST